MTNSEHNDLEKLLKDNLSDKTALVPDFVWDKIEEEIYPKKKRRGFFWLFFLGLGLIAGVGTIYFAAGKSTGKPHLAQVASTERQSSSSGQREKDGIASKQNAASVSAVKQAAVADKHGQNGFATSGAQGNTKLATSSGTDLTYKRSSPKKHGVGTNPGAYGKSGPRVKNGSSTVSSAGTIASASTNGNERSKGTAGEAQTSENKSPENLAVAVDTVKKVPAGQQAVPDSSTTAGQADTTQSETPQDASADEADPVKKAFRRFAVSLYGGTSLYDMAVFKEYFTSGQLSNRSFQSSGFEAGAGFTYQVTRKFGIYTQLAFNRKRTQFNYDLAVTESDYFDHLSQGELLPIANVIDNGIGNCFLAKDVKAGYQVDSWLLSLGGTYQLLSWKKLTVGADVRLSANLSSALTLDELTVLKIDPYNTERFNYLKTGAGLNLDYHFTDRMSLGVSPMFLLQFNGKQSFYAKNVRELVLPVNFKIYF